ncbi:hypothetical protein [Bradyrhizobium diazoefficiens]|uniref:hypothetical protein n=1 Tax=Bradyrhizobium diazoefficiens TaxID=1355477 RepID=UPI000BE8FC6D|nr:hypothetical protein [Bradyrhizobium diazoefficiens]PDT56202.1 hypothetical protein CO678_39455 [Bradyrhizobium diazoefficiens]WLB40521.1 hypothetical protein QIH78_12290 [Bradyrhizobium diazoefficiens]WLC14502.1 hypothetical protein QIH76_30745 [Bradyrhizobium diazoefficiens]
MPEKETVVDFRITPSQDRRSVILSAKRGQKQELLAFPVEVIGQLAAGLLGAAAVCGKSAPIAVGQTPGEVYAMAGSVGLSDIPERPNAFAITFSFGPTMFAIGLSREALKPLGTAMMAASADNKTPQ